MKHLQRLIILALIAATTAGAQTLNNSSLKGNFFFRHLLLSGSVAGATASTAYGILTFDGAGGCSFQGQQNIGSGSGIVLGVTGSYQVQSNGFVSITNPQDTSFLLNARIGTNAIIGSTTASSTTVNDLFIAIPAPATPVSIGTLSGTYQVSSISVPFGFTTEVRNTLFTWSATGQGTFSPMTVTGHAANLGGQVTTQTISGATYTINPGGTGTANFPLPSGATTASVLFGGNDIIYISADGGILIGGSPNPGGLDLIVATKAPSGASNSSLQGVYFTAGLAVQNGALSSFVGSANSTGSGNTLTSSSVRSSSGLVEFTGTNTYALNSAGTGTFGLLSFAVGNGGSVFLAAAQNNQVPTNFEMDVGIAAPAFSGSGVFVNPLGIVNAASFSPAGEPLAPGEIFSIFGTGLSQLTSAAGSLPLPGQISGVQVSVNGITAPLLAVSATQVSAIVPSRVTGSTATIVVNNNGSLSTAVQAPLAATAPGIFSADSSGIGPGAVLHSDYTPVSASNPAKRGETIQIYATGLGATNPPSADGFPAPPSPLSFVTQSLSVLIGSQSVTPSFAGLAPGFAGLYQINVTIPGNAATGSNILLGISTTDAVAQQVTIPIQ